MEEGKSFRITQTEVLLAYKSVKEVVSMALIFIHLTKNGRIDRVFISPALLQQ